MAKIDLSCARAVSRAILLLLQIAVTSSPLTICIAKLASAAVRPKQARKSLSGGRARFLRSIFAAIGAASVALLFIPAPLHTTTEGVVWLPETAAVRAGTDGFVRRFLVAPGHEVKSGEALVESEELTINAELENLRARVSELEARLAAEQFTDRVSAETTATELGQARASLATQMTRAERLFARSRADGTFAVVKPEDLPGRFVHEGQLIGYVLPEGSCIVRATIRQDDIDLVRTSLRGAFVKLAERLEQTLPVRIVREVPAGREDLPSKALAGPGGGAVPVDTRDPGGPKPSSACSKLTSNCRPIAPLRRRLAVAPMFASSTIGNRSVSMLQA